MVYVSAGMFMGYERGASEDNISGKKGSTRCASCQLDFGLRRIFAEEAVNCGLQVLLYTFLISYNEYLKF